MAVVAAITVGTELAQRIKPLSKAVEKIKSIAAKLRLGGTTQDRFIARTQQAFSILEKGGYTGAAGNPRNITYKDFNIGKSDVDDKKPSGKSYYNEFQRLRKYIIARLNSGNPGLGDAYGVYFPDFPMEIYSDGEKSAGQMSGEPLTALKEFVTAYPPGTYKGDLPLPDRSTEKPYSNEPDLTKSKLAAGTAGTDDLNLTKAGFNFGDMNTIVIVILIIITIWYFSK